mmetsp:Transcript_86269/g.200585  ORF Transcript_86269/g.200585 Transcript_86269/m.200585 type:complete len:185 (+) Transcript_86269:71-625(+)
MLQVDVRCHSPLRARRCTWIRLTGASSALLCIAHLLCGCDYACNQTVTDAFREFYTRPGGIADDISAERNRLYDANVDGQLDEGELRALLADRITRPGLLTGLYLKGEYSDKDYDLNSDEGLDVNEIDLLLGDVLPSANCTGVYVTHCVLVDFDTSKNNRLEVEEIVDAVLYVTGKSNHTLSCR